VKIVDELTCSNKKPFFGTSNEAFLEFAKAHTGYGDFLLDVNNLAWQVLLLNLLYVWNTLF
jgi:hypothetical protein